jgi:hypothetical protein
MKLIGERCVELVSRENLHSVTGVPVVLSLDTFTEHVAIRALGYILLKQ